MSRNSDYQSISFDYYGRDKPDIWTSKSYEYGRCKHTVIARFNTKYPIEVTREDCEESNSGGIKDWILFLIMMFLLIFSIKAAKNLLSQDYAQSPPQVVTESVQPQENASESPPFTDYAIQVSAPAMQGNIGNIPARAVENQTMSLPARGIIASQLIRAVREKLTLSTVVKLLVVLALEMRAKIREFITAVKKSSFLQRLADRLFNSGNTGNDRTILGVLGNVIASADSGGHSEQSGGNKVDDYLGRIGNGLASSFSPPDVYF